MLKKRILASSMASVMALSAVSVVAFADETATDDYSAKDVVSKAELKEYVKSFDDFVKNDLKNYGDIQTKRLKDAIAHAKGVAEDSNSTTEEAVTAFQMLKAVSESLYIYSADELKELIASCKSKYDTENVLNEALDDTRWTDDSWEAFRDAYEDADRYVDSKDGRIICDAYCTLEDALNGLKDEEFVTKADFRNVYNQYENIISKLKDYQPWRRGVCTVNTERGEIKQGGEKIDLTLLAYVTYEQLKDIVYGASEFDIDTDFRDAQKVSILKTQTTSTGTFLSVDSGTAYSTTTVDGFVKKAYDDFTENAKATNKASKPAILEAYKTAKEAVAVFNGWEVDDANGGVRDIKYLNDDNTSTVIKKGWVDTFIDGFVTKTTVLSDAMFVRELDSAGKNTGKVKGTDDIPEAGYSIALDKDTKKLAQKSDGTYDNSDYSDPDVAKAAGVELKIIKAGDDITKYIPINSTTVPAPAADTTVVQKLQKRLHDALQMVDNYADEDIKPKADRKYDVAAGKNTNLIKGLDEIGSIAKWEGSYAEYTLIYRNLQYVYDDINASFKDRFSKADVESLISDANELIEATADASALSDVNTDLVNARKAAKEWVAAAKANASYKANKTLSFTASGYLTDTKWTAGPQNNSSTDAYLMLKKYYDACLDELNNYPNSYGEIAETLAEVGDGLASDAYGKSASAIRTLASTVAYQLSVLDATGDENEPFDEDRNIIVYNRVYAKGTDAEKALLNNYTTLVAAMEAATAEPEKPEIVMGDLDGDGKPSPADASKALDLFLNDEYNEAADMDGNGVINAADAYAILEAWLEA